MRNIFKMLRNKNQGCICSGCVLCKSNGAERSWGRTPFQLNQIYDHYRNVKAKRLNTKSLKTLTNLTGKTPDIKRVSYSSTHFIWALRQVNENILCLKHPLKWFVNSGWHLMKPPSTKWTNKPKTRSQRTNSPLLARNQNTTDSWQ